jgi:hypothetical protein
MISATLQQLSESAATLNQLTGLPLAAKHKYWISRIVDKAQFRQREFERSRLDLIKQLGQPVEWVIGAAIDPISLENGVSLNAADQPTGKWMPITDPEKLKQPNVQWMVKEENLAAFDKNMQDLLAENVVMPFSAISIDDLKNAKGEPIDIPFDLTPVLWMFCEPEVGEFD